MRNTFTTILLAAFMAASAQQTNGGFLIKGLVSGLQTGTVYIAFRDDNGKIHNDKVAVANGKFEYKGHVTEPKHFYISTDAQVPPGEFFVENTVMTLSLDAAAPEKVIVKGSATNDQYLAFKASEKDVTEAYASLQDTYFKAIQNKDDQLMASADAKKAEIDARHRLNLRAFCAANPKSVVAEYLVLHTLEFDRNFADIQTIVASLDPSVLHNSTGKSIESKLQVLKDVASEKPESDLDLQPKSK